MDPKVKELIVEDAPFSLLPGCQSDAMLFHSYHTKEDKKIMSKVDSLEVSQLRLHEKDTGSADVQIALLTKRILELTQHLKKHTKDHSSRRGLLKLVADRRSLLDYLKRTASERYQAALEKLQLRK